MYNCEKLLVIDFEATCWLDGTKEDKHYHQEIIQIGFCEVKIRDKFEILEMGSQYIKPVEHTISQFCTKLTRITPANVNMAPTLAEFLGELDKYNKLRLYNKYWASWGRWDLNHVMRECSRKNISSKGFRTNNHLDIKALHSLFTDKKNKKGLSKAVNYFDMDFIGDKHDGKWDALNAARVLAMSIGKEEDEIKYGKKAARDIKKISWE